MSKLIRFRRKRDINGSPLKLFELRWPSPIYRSRQPRPTTHERSSYIVVAGLVLRSRYTAFLDRLFVRWLPSTRLSASPNQPDRLFPATYPGRAPLLNDRGENDNREQAPGRGPSVLGSPALTDGPWMFAWKGSGFSARPPPAVAPFRPAARRDLHHSCGVFRRPRHTHGTPNCTYRWSDLYVLLLRGSAPACRGVPVLILPLSQTSPVKSADTERGSLCCG